MKEFTQTTTGPVGNCWQTAVACLLEVDPAQLPYQATLDRRLVDGKWVGQGYNNPLQAYLRKHHGLAYVEMHLPEEALAMLAVRDPGWHLITGETVRTATLKCRHVVVGRYGNIAWDPHPSRAGLTTDLRYSLLVPFPKAWESYHDGTPRPCVCPVCGGA